MQCESLSHNTVEAPGNGAYASCNACMTCSWITGLASPSHNSFADYHLTVISHLALSRVPPGYIPSLSPSHTTQDSVVLYTVSLIDCMPRLSRFRGYSLVRSCACQCNIGMLFLSNLFNLYDFIQFSITNGRNFIFVTLIENSQRKTFIKSWFVSCILN